jgi:VWFA-related protein
MRSIPMEVTAQSIETRLLNGQSRFDPDEYLVNAKAFQRAHVPAITLRSAPMSMISAMGRAGALPAGVSGKSFDLNSYEQAYNLLCVYLLNLDDNLGTQHRSPPVSEIAAKPAPPNPATEDSQKSGTLVSAVTSPAAATTDNPAASPTAPASVTTLPSQQESVDAIPDIPIFHAETELVLEDVSVTDARGAPVKGLQASDFILMENGKPQAIQVFEAHGPQTGSPAESANPLPAGTFTNRISAAPDAPLSIFLFDLLNTPPQDQAYARAQMLQFLRAMPRGKHVALFVLGTHLEIVQGFTDDAEGLAKMAEKVMRESSPFLTTQLQQQQDQGMAEEVERYAMPTVPSQAPSAVIAGLQAAETQTKNIFMAQRRATAANMEGIRADQRVTATLEALQIIARSVSAYPGRKNLVWLSGSFQIRLRPSSNGYLSVEERTAQALAPVSDLYNTTRYEDAIRAVTTLLANARIAVYPIDVRGLRVGGVELGVGSDQSRNLADFGNNNAYSTMLNDQSNLRADERSSMLDLADQTGGHIFINNDVRGSIARSLEEGSNYYTLAYTPEKNSADKGFRRVQVKMSRGSGTLAYRPGYYPTRLQDLVKQSGAHMLAVAMQPGLPQSTMLLVTARVLPPDVSSKAMRIDYSIDLSGVNFADTVDHRKRALLDCMAVALDGTGNIAGQVANTMDAALRPEEFSTFQRTGLPLHQELVLTPGTYVLRVGVLDRGSQRIGTVNVPLVVSSEAK